MKLTYLAFVFLLSFLMCGNSQTNVNNTAFKFDGLEYKDFDEATKARLKSYGDEVKKRKAKGYVIGYSGSLYKYGQLSAKQIAFYTAWDAVGYDIYSMREKGQLLLVDGGYRQKPFVELFIVPKDAPPPKPTPNLKREDVAFCPQIMMRAPSYIWRANEAIRLAALIKEEEIDVKPAFTWKLSDGEIISGQGTNEISIRHPQGAYQSVTATVEVIGYSPRCENTSSISTPETLSQSPLKITEYGFENCEIEWAQLDLAAIDAANHPDADLYIVYYGGLKYPRYRANDKTYYSRARRGEAEQRAARIKPYLVNSRRIDPRRVKIINGGFRVEWIAEVYLVPQGGKAPVPTPTVAPDKVRFRKGRVGKNEYSCDDIG